jgi:hypothetical protein
MVYERKKISVRGHLLSMIRSDQDLHSHSPSTGEIMEYLPKYDEWSHIWSGCASKAGGALLFLQDRLEIDGLTLDEATELLCRRLRS